MMCKTKPIVEDVIRKSQEARRDILMRLTNGDTAKVIPSIPNVFTKIPDEALLEGEMWWSELYGEGSTKIVYLPAGSISKDHSHDRTEWVLGLNGETTYILRNKEGAITKKGILRRGNFLKIEKGTDHVILSATVDSNIALGMID